MHLVIEKPQHEIVPPHGGKLVNRMVPASEALAWLEPAKSFPQIEITERSYADLEMIAIGGFSPLEGFLSRDDYRSVLSRCRLTDGTLWPIPITLAVEDHTKRSLKPGQPAALVFQGEIVSLLNVQDIYPYDKRQEARQIYKTEDEKHPGVRALYAQPDNYVGGEILAIRLPLHQEFSKYNLTPRDTRRAFGQKKWRTVVGFQTRNPIHRGHEYLTKCALETVDGLLIHPLVGATKKGDIPAAVRMECYEVLIQNYYQPGRVLLSINPSNMFYAGPREALLHALVRKNYGCTHFIVGRDHAGVGNYYQTYEAQDFVRGFDQDDLGIVPLCFENAFWSKKLGGVATAKTSSHGPEDQLAFSGTQLRQMLDRGEAPPPEFTRPEVAQVLLKARR